MPYDPSYPIDSTTVSQLPGAIRTKGENLKALLELAANIKFDNQNSNLSATKVQAAIEELESLITTNTNNIALNADAIAENTNNIALNADAIAENTNNISENTNQISENKSILDTITGLAEGWADARIVEHNLDVADPPNGYYIRWENGLQICFRTATIDLSYNVVQYFPLPADFISYLDIVGGHSIGNFSFGTSDFNLRLAVSGLIVRIKDEQGWGVLIIDDSQTIESFPINLFAIGRWK